MVLTLAIFVVSRKNPKTILLITLYSNVIKKKIWVMYIPVAFVLIKAKLGLEDQVLKDIKSIESVVEAYPVYGVYDVITKLKTESMEKLKETVTLFIRRRENVESTLTMIVIRKA